MYKCTQHRLMITSADKSAHVHYIVRLCMWLAGVRGSMLHSVAQNDVLYVLAGGIAQRPVLLKDLFFRGREDILSEALAMTA